jgi:hypothetical protein
MTAQYDIVVVFWGEAFSARFFRFCLASLLAPGNIPALSEASIVRLVPVTRAADWQEVSDHPLVREVAEWVEVEPIFFSPEETRDKYAAMSLGHAIALERAYSCRRRCIPVCPDALLSDGALMEIHRALEEGAVMVLAPALRFSEDGNERLSGALERAGGGRLALAPRALVSAVIEAPHHETRAHFWGAKNFSAFPVHCLWRLPRARGLLVHTYSWAVIGINLPVLPAHDLSTLDHWTMDGDYVYRNCSDPDALDIVDDSDRLFYVSLTCEAERSLQKGRNPMPYLSLRVSHFSTLMDPLKRMLFRRRVVIHGEPTDTRELDVIGAEASRVLSRVNHPPTKLEHLLWRFFARGMTGFRTHWSDWITSRLNVWFA